jgi:hypothetical protein
MLMLLITSAPPAAKGGHRQHGFNEASDGNPGEAPAAEIEP